MPGLVCAKWRNCAPIFADKCEDQRLARSNPPRLVEDSPVNHSGFLELLREPITDISAAGLMY